MNLEYALERLYSTGWSSATTDLETDRLPDGRAYPTVLAIQREFARAGLELRIQHKLMFSCYRATWAPIGEPLDEDAAADERHGTVVGASDVEAAVYALAQLREAQAERILVS